MNLIDFLQAGGYRFKQATLRKMQSAYFEILKAFVKHLDMPDVGSFIISGCTVVGANITAGMMYIDGELCEFAETAGTDATLIAKNVTFTNLAFKTGASLPVFRATNAIVVETGGVALSAFTRIQTVKKLIWANIEEKPEGIVLDPNFGIPDAQTLIQRIIALEERPVSNVPIGMIAIWDRPAEDIPAGWEEFVEMQGRIPIGLKESDPAFDTLLGYGGSKEKTLNVAELPAHTHGLTVARLNETAAAGAEGIFRGTDETEQTGSTGDGEAFNIMNPYRVVHFIKYVGV